MRPNRLEKLERLAPQRPSPRCGRVSRPPGPTATAYQPDRLGADERREFAGLLRAGTAEPCGRCGRVEYDIARLTDGQKHRTLALLRVLFDRMPDARLCAPGDEGIST